MAEIFPPLDALLPIQLVPATAGQQPILAHLLELYSYDFSAFLPLLLGENGRFGYPDLARYWIDPERHPFLVRIEGRPAGFVLVNRTENTWDMVEFFVVRRYRRGGIGTAIAHQVWKQFPGAWQVRVMESNVAALPFWKHAIAQFTGASIPFVRVEQGDRWWNVCSFQSNVKNI